jgi:hypothetical protein
MTPAQDLPDFAERRPRSVRPPIRRKRKPSLWQFLRRTIQLWAAFTRLLLFRFADRSLGGDELGRELIRARRLRTELERMGGVFVKVGQLLSVRTDLYPWEVCREFANLLDQVVPFPGEVAARSSATSSASPLTPCSRGSTASRSPRPRSARSTSPGCATTGDQGRDQDPAPRHRRGVLASTSP